MTVETNELRDVLTNRFGWKEFKGGQVEVISRLTKGTSTLAVFPTGGGKSLCYQLPALMLDGLTVVVSPLIALMKDQIDQLQSKGVCAVRLDSSLSFDEYRSAIEKIRSGVAKLMYVAPERFFNERFRNELQDIKISLFAIDEAHCISQWGHNFRPDYLKLRNITSNLKVERVLCLTATATPAVQNDICQAFDIAQHDVICTPFYRPNLHLRSQVVTTETRDSILVESLKCQEPGATIVYVTLQKTAEQLATTFHQAGLDAKAYHAGMDAEARAEIQDWFMHGDQRIVVATIAFGMGLDKSDIRYVYHYNPPKSMESYAQEIGRAGRDGQISRCEMLLVPEDRIVLENFVFGDTPSLPSVSKLIEEIEKQPDEFFISPTTISNTCDIRQIVTKTLMTYLELDGYLESTSPRYESYRFKPKITGAELIAKFEGERQEFVRSVLACCQKKRVWVTIDIPEATKKLNCDRMRIIKAFDYFSEKDWIELNASGLVHGYRKRKPFESTDQVAQQYHEKAVEREQAEIQRVRQFFDLVAATECQANMLSAHFGQHRDSPCGNCSSCTGGGPLEIPEPSVPDLSAETIQTVQQLVNDHPDALNSPRAMAKLLCGIRSPALSRAKLPRHSAFGSCVATPFDRVMEMVATQVRFIDTKSP